MANLSTWNDVKMYLCNLIDHVSVIYGGDDKEWLIGYTDYVVNIYKNELNVPIECFEALIQQAKDCSWIRRDYSALEPFTEADRLRPVRR